MNQGKYVFAQLTDFLPQRVFDRLVYEYNGKAGNVISYFVKD
jgi:hypothetical protein